MILGFVCCSNPSGSTNNNTLDYCDICDGVQDESHEHDYCLECDGIQGSDHEHQEVVTPTEPTYDEYFHITTIGGENSPYKVAYADVSEFNTENRDKTVEEQLNLRKANFKTYVENLEFSTEFLQKYNYITTTSIFNGTEFTQYSVFDTEIYNINSMCEPIFEEITKNIKISDNAALDKQLFGLYYKVISIVAEKKAYSDNFNSNQEAQTKYDETKAECTKYDGNAKLPFTNKYFFDESGVINPEVAEQMDLMIVAAANKMGVTANDLRNVINLSLTMNSLDAVHEYTSATAGHTAGDTCPANTMLDVIDSVDASLISKATKLNQSIFKRDLGREMC